jgi:hypothetical protein
MATHLLRDYQTQNVPSGSIDQIAYLLAIFCHRILGYTVVGQTNFNLSSGTYLLASGTTAGIRAGINFGSEYRREVSIPAGIRTVSVSDIGRMLVLRSDANPRFNSGIFLITGVNTADNRYIIDWRSGDDPPAEAADSMPWWLYEEDLTFPNTRGPNAGPGYRSFGSSTCSRIILQSPHSTGWQVRICLESTQDQESSGTNVTAQWTYAPGMGGNSAGDFAVGGDHLHSALWWNANTTSVAQVPGQGRIGSQNQYRLSMVGDTEGTGVYCFIRQLGGPTNWHFQFGMCENEPQPTPLQTARRLFMFGHNSSTNSSQTSAGLVANSFHYHGLTQGYNGQPVSANIASWSFIETNGAFGSGTPGPWYNSSAANNPVTQATELFPVEVVSGMAENWYNNSSRIHIFEPRMMGTLPFVRAGRSNFPNFTLTVGKEWQHMQFDTYMLWGGPAVIP